MYVHKDLKPGMTFSTVTVNPPPAARGYAQNPTLLQPLAVWGKLGTGRGEFSEPRGLAVDRSGNLYVADTKNNRIQKLSPTGEVLAIWGGEGDEPGQFKDPHGIAVGPDGSVYVADTWNHRVQKFDPNGKFIKAVDARARLLGPARHRRQQGRHGVRHRHRQQARRVVQQRWRADRVPGGRTARRPASSSSRSASRSTDAGEVVVADTGNRRLQFFNSDGTFQREWPVFGWEEFYTEPYVATRGDDDLRHRLVHAPLRALRGRQAHRRLGHDRQRAAASSTVRSASPSAPDGSVYVSDTMNNRIQKFDVPPASAAAEK